MGGVVGGLISGIGGSLLSSIGGSIASGLASLAGSALNSITDLFGSDNADQGVVNNVTVQVGNGINDIVQDSQLPDSVKDEILELINEVVGEQQGDVPCDCQEAVDTELGDIIKDFVDQIMEYVNGAMEEESETNGTEGGGTEGGNGNWLVMLAKALGEVNGQHLKTMVEKAGELSDLSEQMEGASEAKQAELASENAVVTAEMQGASRMFSMAQEASSTVIKSIGEGLSSMARKQ